MTQSNTSEDRSLFHYLRLPIWLKLLFLRHEAWALKFARKEPHFATFAVFTLGIVWFILPVILTFVLSILIFLNAPEFWVALVNTHKIWAVYFISLIGIVVISIVFPWQARWFFICIGLSFGGGRSSMAQSKEDEISDRIARLTRMKAARENP